MLEVLIGVISGIVSGMGMGGGTILITILVCFMGIEQKVAQASNLIFFIRSFNICKYYKYKK